jgi:hypothetical protein
MLAVPIDTGVDTVYPHLYTQVAHSEKGDPVVGSAGICPGRPADPQPGHPSTEQERPDHR